MQKSENKRIRFALNFAMLRIYLRGNSTKMVTATMMMKSKMVSLYISCPMRVSQHCEGQHLVFKALGQTATTMLLVIHYYGFGIEKKRLTE